MTREQAKIYVKLSKEDLKELAPRLLNHYDFLKAFAEGVEIEEKCEFGWVKTTNPEFYEYSQYRFKKPVVTGNKPLPPLNWTPDIGESYYFVNISSRENNVMTTVRDNTVWSEAAFQDRAKLGNVFKDRNSAEQAFQVVLETLENIHSCKTTDLCY